MKSKHWMTADSTKFEQTDYSNTFYVPWGFEFSIFYCL